VRGIFDEEEDEEGRCLAYGMEMGMEVKREVDSRLASYVCGFRVWGLCCEEM
jgi:hypothetical protein